MAEKKTVKTIHVALGCVFTKIQARDIESKIASNSGNYYQVLLAKRRERQLPEIDNMWELPGGKVEQNELPMHTVERELLEETGYRVRAISPLDIVYTFVRDYPEYKQETVISCFECELLSTDRVQTKPDRKIEDVRWFRLDEIEYFKTLVGSREFLFFLAKKHKIRIETTVKKTISHASFQVPLDAEKRKGREYIVNIQLDPDLTSYYLVTFRRGINRRNWRPMIEGFVDNDSMIKTAKKRVSTRFHHGYFLVDYDDDFPIINWIKEKGYPIQLENKKTPFQMTLPYLGPNQSSKE
jgi:8-oxo-dGTP pyrophosphatase MutT (NUDIX family)